MSKWKAVKGDSIEPDRWYVVTNDRAQHHIAVIENGAPGDTPEGEAETARLLAAAPETAAERDKLLALAKGYEQWEGELIMCNEAWAPEGMAEFPHLTEKLYDRLLELQTMRNEAFAKVKAVTL